MSLRTRLLRIAMATIGGVPIIGAAQDSLIITGRVATDSGAPLVTAHVSVSALRHLTLTSSSGRYRLAVPVAGHEGERFHLNVQLIGYRIATDTFTLTASAIVRDFTLTPIPLDFGCGPSRPRAPSKDRRPFTAEEILDLLRALYVDCGPGPDLRDRVLDDSIVLNYFAALLLGRSPWPLGADTANALHWLIQSGDARFLPVYLRLSVIDSERTTARRAIVFNNAVVGLVALDTLPEARVRIAALGQVSTPAAYRSSVAFALARQNRESDRAPLCKLRAYDLAPKVREMVDQALAASPRDASREFTVPAIPPCTKPKWFQDDSSWAGPDHHGYLKRAIGITFEPQATRQQKQLAVDTIHGRVVGGSLVGESWGYYLVRVDDDGTGKQLGPALAVLHALPQVQDAELDYRLETSSGPIHIRGIRCSGPRDSVPADPPSGRPAWLYDDTAQIPGSGRVSKSVIIVAFTSGASREQKQAAVDSVCGTVVGGMPGPDTYYIKIPTDGSERTLYRAVDMIKAMPGVLTASIYVTGGMVP